MANPTGKNQYNSKAAAATATRMARMARNKELYALITGTKPKTSSTQAARIARNKELYALSKGKR